MKSSRKRQVKNHELLARGYSKTGDKVFKPYLKPRDIPSRKAVKVLNRLNSFDSAEQLKGTIQKYTKETILVLEMRREFFIAGWNSGNSVTYRRLRLPKELAPKSSYAHQ